MSSSLQSASLSWTLRALGWSLLCVLSGSGGGGAGEFGVAVGVPAGPGVGPVADDEGGLLGVVLQEVVEVAGVEGASLATGGGGATLEPGAGAAQPTEGDAVAAGLGGEVPAEAEHVGPLAQQGVRTLGQRLVGGGRLALLPVDGLGDGRTKPVQVWARRVGGVGGGLSRVLGEVAGDLFGLELLLGVVGAVGVADRS